MTAGEPGYPPEPWRLRGEAFLSVWRVPLGWLPPLPPGCHPVSLGSAAVVVSVFVDYRGGVLSYRELLVAVAVRHEAGLGALSATVTGMWVDSRTAQAGGRVLWSLPKERAEFDVSSGPEHSLSARDSRGPVASATFRRRAGLPVRVPVRFTVVQERGGSVQRTPARASGLPGHAAARWTFDPDGPLGYLHGLRPTRSVVVRDVRLRFGRR
jgi:hypothetical protein